MDRGPKYACLRSGPFLSTAERGTVEASRATKMNYGHMFVLLSSSTSIILYIYTYEVILVVIFPIYQRERCLCEGDPLRCKASWLLLFDPKRWQPDFAIFEGAAHRPSQTPEGIQTDRLHHRLRFDSSSIGSATFRILPGSRLARHPDES